MKPNTRKRFIRAFVSSVLSSEMTEKELIEVINEFPHDAELNIKIKRRLNSILSLLHATQTNEGEFMQMQFNDQFETVYAKIQKRRLPKEILIEVIRSVVGPKRINEYSTKNTARELLDKFYSGSSKREQDLFIELLDFGKSKDDAFLQGIIRKK